MFRGSSRKYLGKYSRARNENGIPLIRFAVGLLFHRVRVTCNTVYDASIVSIARVLDRSTIRNYKRYLLESVRQTDWTRRVVEGQVKKVSNQFSSIIYAKRLTRAISLENANNIFRRIFTEEFSTLPYNFTEKISFLQTKLPTYLPLAPWIRYKSIQKDRIRRGKGIKREVVKVYIMANITIRIA